MNLDVPYNIWRLLLSWFVWCSFTLTFTITDMSKDRLCGIRDLIWSNECVPLLSPRDACSLQPNTSIAEILVMVPSSLLNFERRDALRESWADTPLVREGKIKVIFVLGQNLRASQVLSYQRYKMRLFCWVPWITLLAKFVYSLSLCHCRTTG